METIRAHLGLGSNLGDRKANLDRAVGMLGEREGIEVVRVSAFVQTEPVGGPPGQGRYLNAAAEIETTLAPRELLRACQEIEKSLGRTRGPEDVRWGPRTMDIDILLYGEQVVRETGLEIPHPRMHKRAFVLGPLAEIAGEAWHPLIKAAVADLARDVPVRPEGAVSAYLRLQCDNEGYEVARAACEAHEGITMVEAALVGQCCEVACPCEEAFLEVYTILSLRELLGFCDELAKKLRDSVDEPGAGTVVVLLYGMERDAALEMPHPSLKEEIGVLQGLAHLAPYAWVPDVGKTAGELLDERQTTARRLRHLAAGEPGRN